MEYFDFSHNVEFYEFDDEEENVIINVNQDDIPEVINELSNCDWYYYHPYNHFEIMDMSKDGSIDIDLGMTWNELGKLNGVYEDED